MNATLPFVARGASAVGTVPRQALTFVRLAMPSLARNPLRDAVRLQLTQYMAPGAFGFVCRAGAAGRVAVWAWPVTDARGPRRGGAWPETVLDDPAAGLRLVRRAPGFEAQQWADGELLHSRWFETSPDAEQWQAFVRGCGADPQQHPLPEAVIARTLRRPARGWIAGDNLPAPNPWQGWHWQAGALLLGIVIAAGLGIHLQTRRQLEIDTARLQALRGEREAALQARRRYEQAADELGALRTLVPKLTQLDLLDRVNASGVFEPVRAASAPAPASAPKSGAAPPAPAAAAAPATPPPPLPAVRMLDWDYRNGLLKMTLDVPEREVKLLEVVRRLEAVPGLAALRVLQDSAGNTLSVSARVADLAPVDSTRPAGAAP